MAPKNTMTNSTPEAYDRLAKTLSSHQRRSGPDGPAQLAAGRTRPAPPPRRPASPNSPQRPAQLAALHQRVDQQEHAERRRVSAPVTSSRRSPRCRPTAGSAARPAISAKAPSGRLMANTARQPVPARSALTSTPATTGPRIVDSPMTGPERAERLADLPRREEIPDQPEALRDHRRAEQRPAAAGRRSAFRATVATAHSSDAATKPATPISSIRRRPNMSPSRPPVSSPTAIARV